MTTRKGLPLPVLLPGPEVLCLSCTVARSRAVGYSGTCAEASHARIIRREWERQNGEGLPMKDATEITLGPTPRHGS